MSTSTATEPVEDVRPDWADPEMFHEIVDGKWVELPSMGYLGGLIAQRLYNQINAFVEPRGLGQALIEIVIHLYTLPGRQKRRPDVAFLSAERWPLDLPIPGRGDLRAVPELAIEVISPGDRDADVQRKLEDYFRAGVLQVWLVRSPSRTITVYDGPGLLRRYEEDGEIECDSLLPGFRLAVGSVFPATIDADDGELTDSGR